MAGAAATAGGMDVGEEEVGTFPTTPVAEPPKLLPPYAHRTFPNPSKYDETARKRVRVKEHYVTFMPTSSCRPLLQAAQTGWLDSCPNMCDYLKTHGHSFLPPRSLQRCTHGLPSATAA